MKTATLAAIAGIIGLSMGAAACGGGSKSSSTNTKAVSTKATTTTTTSAPTSTASSGTGTVASITAGSVRGTLHATNHAPVAGANWVYTVTVTDASGRPLSGTVDTEFVYGGQVVGRETPPTHPLRNGRLRDVIQFPARSVGVALTLQTVVHSHLGSITLDWPVTAKR